MNIKIQVIIGVTIVIAMVIIVNMIRKKMLELRYALAWLVVGCGVLVLNLFPNVISCLANMMGIETPINMLFFLGFCFSLGIIFVLTLAVSRMSIRIKSLAQELAILQNKGSYNSENESIKSVSTLLS